MGNNIAASEIIQIAVQIERNGLDFYTALAARAKEKGLKDVFTMLAKEEEKHISAFQKLGGHMVDPSTDVSSDEYSSYMRALASEHIFTRAGTGTAAAGRAKTDAEAIDFAIGFEKDSIIYYQGMKQSVPAGQERAVDALIVQEQNHLRKLVSVKSGCISK